MLFTRTRNGELLIEVRFEPFKLEWVSAPIEQRCVLEDHRPAVRRVDELGVTYTTLHPEIWERVKSHIKPLLNHGKPLEKLGRAKRCSACGDELKVVKEFEGVWVMRCPRCASLAVLGKAQVGGTIGAGEKEQL